MKTSRLSLIVSLTLGLLASAWAQVEETDPTKGGVRQDSPAGPSEKALPKEAAKEESTAEVSPPSKIDYPTPVTEAQKKAATKHSKGSQKLAIEQDELSADVQDLVEEQTNEKVIQLLELVEEIMGEVTDSLDQTKTGGRTIAAETEIIEKIYEAAKQRAQSNGGT